MATTDTLNYCYELLGNSTKYDECHKRNIIGRAYYHAFYEVRHHLEQRLLWPVTNTKCGAHEKVYSRLSGYPAGSTSVMIQKRAAEIKNRVQKLKRFRTTADYHLHLTISNKLINYILHESRQISEQISKL
ncbi:hypothetical protein RJ730_18185 [Acinetobacter baumannii]|uniref:hypothetical protein n=1 Tax=Acinetobacter baumannii TaxID=470 RepID=UPI003896D3AC